MRYVFSRQQERGFGELAVVVAIFGIADGAYCQNNVDIRIDGSENIGSLHNVVGTLVDGEFLLLKQSCRTFLAVVDNLTRLLQPIDMVGA